jgi:adenylyltransferase/sulfurtransferase
VLGVLPGLIGVIQATEVIKLITLAGESLIGRLLLVDALHMRFRTIELMPDPECPACGTREITSLMDYDSLCGFAPTGTGSATYAVAETEDDDEDEITPQRLDARMRGGAALTLIDVREPYEWAIARLPDARLVPLNSLPRALHSIARAAEIVVYCHHGTRSAAAAEWLRDQGFERVLNLVGGVDRWSLEVDPTMRRY